MKVLCSAALALSVVASAPASAATVVFQDDFSSYGNKTQLNAKDSLFNGNWTTTSGTVDYLAAGDRFGNLCAGGGNCIDLDGSSNDAGVFSTGMSFNSGVFNVLFQIAGNNRFGTDIITITFGSISRTISLAYNQVASQASFGADFLGIAVGAAGTKLSFANAGGDKIGVILKNVVIEQDANVVPVPAAGGFLVAALGALAVLRRRKAA